MNKKNIVIKNIVIFSTAFLIILLDQLTKFLVKQALQLNQSIPIIRNILHFTYTTNTGSAFGLFKGLNLIFVLFSIIVIFAIFYFIKKIKNLTLLLQFAIGSLLGGTIGNLIDRLFYGYVIDFIDFRIWHVFNAADSFITISVIFLIILLWNKP